MNNRLFSPHAQKLFILYLFPFNTKQCIENNAEVYCINESNLFLRNLIHDCGIKLKAYAICMQIRRTRDGFVDANDVNNCLVHTEWDSFQRLHDHVIALTEITRERINEYDKQILVGKKRITNEDQSTTPNELNF